MKKNTNDKEKEKLRELSSNNFVKLDESLSENKDSKIFETDKGKLDFKIDLNRKGDDIVIEDNNDYNKDKNKIASRSNKVNVENKFDKKEIQNTKEDKKEFHKINNNINHEKIIEVKNNENHYNSNEQMNIVNQNPNNNSYNKKSKYDLSFNNLVYDTLDEPVCETLKRDLKRIIYKLECVLLPRFKAEKHRQINNWDLWGPLLFCLMLCLTITFASENSQAGNVFISLFTIVWVGGIIITLNSKFLGAQISIFQTLCLLGYCIFPINLAALIVRLTLSEALIKIVVVGCAYIWSCFSSVGFMSVMIEEDKKMIAVYPIFLFYLFISWFVLTT